MWNNFLNIISTVCVIVTTVISLFIYFNNRKAAFNILASLLILVVSIWSGLLLATLIFSDILFGRLLFSFGIEIVPFFILFMLMFAGHILTLKKIVLITALPLILSSLGPIKGLLFKEASVVNGVFMTSEPGPLLALWEATYFIYLGILIYLFVVIRREVTGVKKVQLNYLTIGLFLSFSAGTVTNLILPMMGIFSLGHFGPLTTLPLSIMMIYVATKHHILEVRVVLSEVWALLLTMIVFAAFWRNRQIFDFIVFAAVSCIAVLFVQSVLSESDKNRILRLQNRQLFKAKKDLEALDKLKGEFLNMAMHELNTPVAAIKSILSVIFESKHSTLDEKQKKELGPVWDASDRLSHLIKNVFDASYIDQGNIWINKSEADMVELVDEAVENLKKRAKDRSINLIWRKPKNLSLNIYIDKDKIYDIIFNLIENAIKFTYDGQVEVSLSEDGDIVSVAISDTGVGISGEDQKKLFSKFFQSARFDEKMPQEQQGAGLGLYISKNVVKLHGGDIKVVSELHHGSTFTVTLSKEQSPAGKQPLKQVQENTLDKS